MDLAAERVDRRIESYGELVSCEAITQDAAVVGTLTVPAAALSAVVSAWIDCSHRSDGTDPTTTVGHPLLAGLSVELFGQTDMTAFKIISQSATGTVFVTYYA